MLRSELPSGFRLATGICSYVPGFPAAVHYTADEWVAHGDGLVTAAPIREVGLATVPDLEVDQQPGEDGFRACIHGRGVWMAFRLDADVRRAPFRHAICSLLAAEWPGLTFHLPPQTVDDRLPPAGRMPVPFGWLAGDASAVRRETR